MTNPIFVTNHWSFAARTLHNIWEQSTEAKGESLTCLRGVSIFHDTGFANLLSLGAYPIASLQTHGNDNLAGLCHCGRPWQTIGAEVL